MVIRNREYHKRARWAGIRRELERRGIDAFYRPPQRPEPIDRADGSRSGLEQARLAFPPLITETLADALDATFPLHEPTEEELREALNHLFPPDATDDQ